MYKVVLLRHGQSEWNKLNLFTGWQDVDLTEQGVQEAREAGRVLKEEGFRFDVAYTSVLKRAIKTLNNALEVMGELWVPTYKSWRLNEKSYGALQGLNKAETAAKYGEDQVLLWRRSQLLRWRHTSPSRLSPQTIPISSSSSYAIVDSSRTAILANTQGSNGGAGMVRTF